MSYTKDVEIIIRGLRPLLLKHWGTAAPLMSKSESPADIVTQVDLEIEDTVKKKLATLDSTISFVGEESGGDRGAKRFWLMDPLDGTAPYVRGLPFSTVMIALIEEGQVTFSAIYDFINDHLYTATRGGGAYLNGSPIHVSDRALKISYYCVETRLNKPENLERFQKLTGRGHRINSQSAGWEFAMVASGKLDARICCDPYGKDYDFAPGCLLVEEAGGIVRNLGSNSYDYRNLNFIASNPVNYDELAQIFGPA